MGLGTVNLFKLVIVVLIVVLIFGSKWLKTVAAELGGAAKGLRDATRQASPPQQAKPENAEPDAEFPEQKQRSGRG